MKSRKLLFVTALLFVLSFTASAAPLSTKQEHLDEALISAVLGGTLKQVERLLKQGADVDVHDGDDGTPLILISCAGSDEDLDARNISVAADLLRYHADVNAINSDGETALMGAASTGNVKMTALLLAYHARVNIRDKSGQTALMQACYQKGNLQTVRMLLAHHANVNARDPKG